jgi:catechol 2,3-dioxygenase-like lactoylglutathione lyase family enzyme
MSIRSIDHIVILVNNLEQTIADYTALGFTVVRGGEHPGGATHNALVAFADGAYLELIAFKQPAERQRWWQLGQRSGEGLVDYALLPSTTAEVVAEARARELELEGPTDGGRVRPDGARLQWQTARAATADLPFLCGDITPRSLRVPEGEARQHVNGALGVAGITVAVADLAASVARYQALLGDTATVTQPAVIAGLGIRTAALRLGAAQITLATPASDSGPAGLALREHLTVRGEGPYAVAFATASSVAAQTLDHARAHGARLELVDHLRTPSLT